MTSVETIRIERRPGQPSAVASVRTDHGLSGGAWIGSGPRDITVMSPVPAVSITPAAFAAVAPTAFAAGEPIYAAAQFRTQGLSVGVSPMPKSVVIEQQPDADQQGTGVARAAADLMAERSGVPPRGKPECPA